MKKWLISLAYSFTLIGLSLGVIQGNLNLMNYLLFASILLLLLCILFTAGAFYIAIMADEGDKGSIEDARKFMAEQVEWRARLFLIAILTATGTALYFGWIMTAVMFATAEIIALPVKGLMRRAAQCEPSFGDETLNALQDIEE